MLARLLAAVGLPIIPIALGLGFVLGAGPAGYLAYKVGHGLGDHAGYERGVEDADQAAELNLANQKAATAEADKATAEAATARAQETAAAATAARTEAEEALHDYQSELAKRGPAGACALGDADLGRMRPNHHRRVRP